MWSSLVHKFEPGNDVFVAFLARNCLDVFRSQNRLFQTDTNDGGWTCKYGRTFEWLQYHKDPDLRGAIQSENDMICTIKQSAFKNFQRHAMNVSSGAIAYSSFHIMPSFVGSKARSSMKLGSKEIAGAIANPAQAKETGHSGSVQKHPLSLVSKSR